MAKAQTHKLTFKFEGLESDERLRELILYISEKCCDDHTFGATKLNKILFFSDFLHYAEHGTPITGVEYMKLPQGPAPRRMLPVQNKMKKSGEIAIALKSVGCFTQKPVIPQRRANLSAFTAEEIAQVERVIKVLWGHTAATVSHVSHQRAWRITAPKESIPYEAALLSDQQVTDYEINRTKELSVKYGWKS